jgi:hypothetical protein
MYGVSMSKKIITGTGLSISARYKYHLKGQPHEEVGELRVGALV